MAGNIAVGLGRTLKMRVLTDCGGKSIVQHRFRNDVNINTIVNKARIHGLPPATNRGFFGDFSNIDFQAMQNTVCRAQEAFNALPSNIRARFHNNPVELIEFVEDRENLNEAIKLGLIPEPPKVQDQNNEVKPSTDQSLT